MPPVVGHGELPQAKLSALAADYPRMVRDVRGLGLMLGMELHRGGEHLVEAMRDRHNLINCTDTTVLRFVPPLTVNAPQVERTASALRDILGAIPAHSG